jgi:D-glycero-alpha-D-manno-heptose-7-phosphate kinase
VNFLNFDNSEGLEIHHQGDLPARSGIGSSSTFAVGLIRALTTLRGQQLSQREVALKALELEQKVLKENVGSQDQIAAAYGGLNTIHFTTAGDFRVEPVPVKPERVQELEQHLLLLYTGSSRLGGEIAANVIAGMRDKTAELRQMRRLVDQALAILTGTGSLSPFGELLHQTWTLKRGLAAGVSNSEVDAIYQTAQTHGALGGKLLGAGAKGFMLFYAPPETHAAIRQELKRYVFVPFAFEREGSVTIYGNSRT